MGARTARYIADILHKPLAKLRLKKSFVPLNDFLSIIGLLLTCTTTSKRTSVVPSQAGITPQALATLKSRPVPLPNQDSLGFLHSALLQADVAIDRRVHVHQDTAPFAHDSDTPGHRSAVQNKASAHQLALPAIRSSGARPVLDRQRLEKTANASLTNDSDTPGLRSAVQNKASAHQLALPAIISCPIAPKCPHFQLGEMPRQTLYNGTWWSSRRGLEARKGRSSPRARPPAPRARILGLLPIPPSSLQLRHQGRC